MAINSTNVRFCQTTTAIRSPAIPYVMDVLPSPTIQQGELEQLRQVLEPLHSLGDLLEWGRELTPPVASPVVVTQDEYTHDVVLEATGLPYLVFDTT